MAILPTDVGERRVALVPLVAMFVVLVVICGLYALTRISDPRIDHLPAKPFVIDTKPIEPKQLQEQLAFFSRESTARITWNVAAVTLVIAMLVVVGLWVQLIRRRWKSIPIFWRLILVVAVLAPMASGFFTSRGTSRLMGPARDALEFIHLRGLKIADVLAVFNGLGFTAPVILCSSFCVVLVRRNLVPQTAQELADSVRESVALLYGGTALLVAGVFQIGALYNWAAAMLVADHGREFVSIAKAISSCAGASYTLLLAAMYSATALTLRLRSLQLARAEEVPQHQIEKWLEEQKLNVGSATHLSRVVATLAPLIAGTAIPSLLNVL